MESFIRLVNKYNALEKHPKNYGTRHAFYHSERHTLDVFGDNPGINMTEMAKLLGMTKGAVSQVASKLEKKGAVLRYKNKVNEKEVYVELTAKGREIHERHKAVNLETIAYILRLLKDHPDEKVEFLLDMFKSFEEFLECSADQMKTSQLEG